MCGIFASLAMIFGYLEMLLPIPFPVPGMKLGVANLVIVTGLYVLRPQEVAAISLIRIVLSAFLFGTMMSFWYSLAGGALSFLVMCGVKKLKGFSAVGVSVSGGVAHNIGQFAVAAAVIQNRMVFTYLPPLILAGTLTGLLMGLLASAALPAVKQGMNGR